MSHHANSLYKKYKINKSFVYFRPYSTLQQISVRGRKRCWLARITAGETCKIKSLARMGSSKNPSTFKPEIWNRREVVSVEKSYLLKVYGALVIYRQGLKKRQLLKYQTTVTLLQYYSCDLLQQVMEVVDVGDIISMRQLFS